MVDDNKTYWWWQRTIITGLNGRRRGPTLFFEGHDEDEARRKMEVEAADFQDGFQETDGALEGPYPDRKTAAHYADLRKTEVAR